MVFFVLVAFVVLVIFIIISNKKDSNKPTDSSGKTPTHSTASKGNRWLSGLFESDQKRSGRMGEETVARTLQNVSGTEDHLINNVSLEVEGKRTELDCVVINQYGVFIFEVKNYHGSLYGTEDDYEWFQDKVSFYGNNYQSYVKNPIKQVKRQIYVLKNYLAYYDIHVWIKGYAVLVNNNSPVQSEMVLTNGAEIEHAIHPNGKKVLSEQEVLRIVGLLS